MSDQTGYHRQDSFYLMGWFILVAGGCSLLALYLQQLLWPLHLNVMHSIIEICCFMVAIFCFMIIWHTAGQEPQLNLVIAFSCLAIGIFDLLHLYYFPGLKLFPIGYYDLYSRMFAVSVLLQALLACFLVSRIKVALHHNRWVMLLMVILFSVTLASLIYYDPLGLPSITNGGGLTRPYALYRWFIALVLLFCLLSIILQTKGIHRGNLLIPLALILSILMQLCMIYSHSSWDFLNIMGHLLRLSIYLCVLLRVLSLAFIDPYHRLQNLLNRLPLGMAIYSSNNNILLLNARLREIHTLVRSTAEVAKAFASPRVIPPHPPGVDLNQPLIKIPKPGGQMLLLQHDRISLPDGSSMHLYIDVSYEQELTQLRLQTQTILNSIPNPVLILDAQQRVLSANPAVDYLLKIKVQPGDSFHQLIQSLTYIITNHRPPSEETSSTHIDCYEISLVNSDERILNLVLNFSVIKGLQSEALGYVIVAQDITSIKAQYELLKQQEKLAVLGQMAAGIVHEIKNPLTSIRGFSQMLLDQKLIEPCHNYVEVILEAADDVNKVVSDFLSFARPRPPQLTTVSLSQLLDSVMFLLQSNSLMQDINIQYDLSPDDLPVYADRQQLKQVILNLTKNALEALAETKKPLLRFSTSRAENGEEMILSITDNGPGIALDEQSYLGTPFFTTKDRGTGLGLSICYQIIKEHGGNIQVTSRPGEGTTFTISLPSTSNTGFHHNSTA
ncbi:MAG: ATP-binding protein [Methylocystaceae bacterium]